MNPNYGPSAMDMFEERDRNQMWDSDPVLPVIMAAIPSTAWDVDTQPDGFWIVTAPNGYRLRIGADGWEWSAAEFDADDNDLGGDDYGYDAESFQRFIGRWVEDHSGS